MSEVVRGSGDAAVAAAEARAQSTGGRNITPFSELPIAEDTANLRFGPDLHPGLLALLPLVGVWEGEGEGQNDTHGTHRFGQQIIVTHDGENYLTWSSRAWVLPDAEAAAADDAAGSDAAAPAEQAAPAEPAEPDPDIAVADTAESVTETEAPDPTPTSIPAYRESGFWRINDDDDIEFLVAHASGVIEMYYGEPLHQAAWEVATDVVLSSRTGVQTGGAKRLYGIVEGGDLGWVEERAHPEQGLVPHLSARLKRVAG